jgi:hypothetical protein
LKTLLLGLYETVALHVCFVVDWRQ